jgi:HD-like signal output (HDOD) protein
MQPNKTRSLEEWVAYLTDADIPVLKQTARELTKLHDDKDNVSARAVAKAIERDPMMTVKLLRFLQKNKRNKQEHEVMEVEQAMLMLGVEAFFTRLPAKPLVDEMMRSNMPALVCLLYVVTRAHRASSYAFDWAVRLRDLHFEEVRIAALLHDLAEILMWCFSPNEMLKIHNMQQADKSLRSRDVQVQMFGFPLDDLQLALAHTWALPQLLTTLMDKDYAEDPRVRNVLLAVNLARHSANGWDDAALPDDFKDIGVLLSMEPDDVQLMIEEEAGLVCQVDKTHL